MSFGSSYCSIALCEKNGSLSFPLGAKKSSEIKTFHTWSFGVNPMKITRLFVALSKLIYNMRRF